MCVYYMMGAPEGSPKVVLWRMGNFGRNTKLKEQMAQIMHQLVGVEIILLYR